MKETGVKLHKYCDESGRCERFIYNSEGNIKPDYCMDEHLQYSLFNHTIMCFTTLSTGSVVY